MSVRKKAAIIKTISLSLSLLLHWFDVTGSISAWTVQYVGDYADMYKGPEKRVGAGFIG